VNGVNLVIVKQAVATKTTLNYFEQDQHEQFLGDE